MNQQEFNNSFPSFEKQFYQEQQIKEQMQKQIQEDKIKHKFEQKYPNLCFKKLKKQNDDMLTDDGCTHYIYPDSNQVYSYDFIENEWIP